MVDRLKLQSAKLNQNSAKCALQMMGCLFSTDELVNGNPSGITNSKDEARRRSIRKLDPNRMKYIYGNVIAYHVYQLPILLHPFSFLLFRLYRR